ncbi:hypothetical protein [Nonomuraea ferruginea]|uniref:Uncharacterized protein n=1 Tax=Nonomuraea ferruginea TaxID=46174 RepID=A0ABT4T292_9ACTN|nr:hypothetical protein [Nonomuraea ferruginea]MDA0643641.1 hypothetical protein [Nonomuraea ferruginea]
MDVSGAAVRHETRELGHPAGGGLGCLIMIIVSVVLSVLLTLILNLLL